MKGVSHATSTHALAAPQGWDQRDVPCDVLPVTKTTLDGLPVVKSYWKPTDDEIAALAAGAFVTLSIVGNTMPPVAVGVEE